MLKIGITGGIGSGKSTACSVFEHLGVPIYNSDVRAKELMSSSSDLIHALKEAFGASIYTGDRLNRPVLASIVFNDEEKLKLLNSIVHPAVGKDYAHWLSQNKEAKYTLKEAALLYEAGIYKDLDKIILVTCPVEERIKRVMKRDKVSKEEVERRIANQWTEERKLELADYVLDNSGDVLLLPQVLQLHRQLQSF